MANTIGGVLIGLYFGGILATLFIPFPSAVGITHCKARGLEYSQIATSGEIECVKVTREVVK